MSEPIPAAAVRDLTVVTDDGIELSVADRGPRHAGHTVVFLHGLCLTRATWGTQINRLARQSDAPVRVISYDHRGHGRSARAPAHTYRIDRLADDLEQILAATETTGPLTLVGHSMGGMTALTYLSRHPAAAHGLVLAATTAGLITERGLGRLLATPATAALVNLAALAPEYALRAMARPVCATVARWRQAATASAAAALAATALTAASPSTAVGFLLALRDWDQRHSLSHIQAKTVVLSGAADLLTPPICGEELAAGIAGAEYVHLPTAGHMLPHEAPRALNDAIQHVVTSTDDTSLPEVGMGAAVGVA